MAGTGRKQGKKAVALPLAVPDDAAVQVWVQLAQTYHRIARRLDHELAKHDLTLAQFEVLCRLHFDGPVTQTALAQRLLVTKGNVCGLLDRLAAANLVSRQTDANDRRANIVELTNAGCSLLAKSFPEHITLVKQLLHDLSSEELHVLYNSLARLETSDS